MQTPRVHISALAYVGNGHIEDDGRFVFDLSPQENNERAGILAAYQSLFEKGAWIVPGVPNTPHLPWRKVIRELDKLALALLRKTCEKRGEHWVLPKNRLVPVERHNPLR